MTEKEIKRDWYLIDAANIRLGRLATEIATRLIGKNKVQLSGHLDNGDQVVVINAKKLSVHPKKLDRKMYYRHSGHMGGLKQKSLKTMMDEKPEEVIRLAVRGMLPNNKIGSAMLKRLYVFEGESHPHEAQKPIKIEIENS